MGTKKKIQELKAIMAEKAESCEYGIMGCDTFALLNEEEAILERYKKFIAELEEMENCFSEDYEPTAKEMFENLGYKEDYRQNGGVGYLKKVGEEQYIIYFVLRNKEPKINHYMVYKKMYILEAPLSLLEIKAINKQIEELGW